ncbi:hypothetical protein OH807_29885 [Kitasatospora sp. NBC_01560]|uniref:hypothetical protein n=1 Tax=Kitasatospora sp. NBC_01560 TaxID=2975965 RepID=UPI00386ADAF6
MLPKTVRGAVEVAAGLVEEVGKRVVVTAAGLLERTGIDVTEVERRLGGQFPPSAKSLQTLAEEAVTAGRAGVDLAVGVARSEVERAFEKVGDQVTKVGVVLAYLESKLREVEEDGGSPAKPGAAASEPGPAPRADALFGQGWEQENDPVVPAGRAAGEPIVAERVEVDEPVEVDPVVPSVARPDRQTAGEKAPVAEPPVKKTTANKTATQKAVAQKAAAKKVAAEKATPAGTKPAGAKPATRKTAVKKTATAKKTAEGRRTATGRAAQAARQEQPAKRTATKKTTVRRTSSTKKPERPDA